MHTETIQVVKKWPPNGAGPGALVDERGRRFKAWPDKWAQVIEGGLYEVGYTKEEWQGKEQLSIKNLKLAGGSPSPVVPLRSNGPLAPNKSADTNKQISVLAIFKTVWPTHVALEDAAVDEVGMAKVLRKCMKAYDMSLGGQNILPADEIVEDIGDTFR